MTSLPEPPVTERRGPGRPRAPRPEVVTAPPANIATTADEFEPEIDTRELWYGLPCMPDDEMEMYGGDLAALDAWSKKSGRKFATWREASATSTLVDLSPKGMLVNRHAPEQLFHFVFLLEDGGQTYQQALLTMRKRGYRAVTVADWHVHSVLRDLLVPEDGKVGRLTLGGALRGGSTVVFAQDEPNYRKFQKLARSQSDEIQKTAAQRSAGVQDSISKGEFAGVMVSTAFDDE